ncbi:GFA family protein [Sphingosinicella sp. BN140058]|uniref:GFA family protein n=1 Tax=Sphingosinicella sp. BN140058 TaxID=1892855 RepID=UPI0010138846|nr:GFA family protein [Sphingosinicella sp. BN140058]QAY75396.1 GFA family protein [Sphingosinicella sp. BN140058]
MSYAGSCHCGAVAFEVAGDPPAEAMSCNCSHCRRKGFLLSFVPAARFAVTQGEALLKTYTFNTHRLRHRFCTECGVQPFSEGTAPDGAETRAINLRCVPSIDLDGLTVQKVNGADF